MPRHAVTGPTTPDRRPPPRAVLDQDPGSGVLDLSVLIGEYERGRPVVPPGNESASELMALPPARPRTSGGSRHQRIAIAIAVVVNAAVILLTALAVTGTLRRGDQARTNASEPGPATAAVPEHAGEATDDSEVAMAPDELANGSARGRLLAVHGLMIFQSSNL